MLHFDQGQINKIDVLPNGMLRIWGTIAQTGPLLYFNADGSKRLEHVSNDVLYETQHLDSIGGTTLTLGHPEEKVTPDNYKKYSVGATGTQIIKREDLGTLEVVTIVADRAAIDAIQKDGIKDLSMGYDCQIEKRSDGDYNQLNRICNHLAIVEKGRASKATLRLDEWQQDQAENIQVKPTKTKAIRITSVVFP